MKSERLMCCVFLGMLAVLAFSSAAHAQNPVVIYVDPQAGNPPPTGTGDFSSPFQTLQQAADVANQIPRGIPVDIFIIQSGDVAAAALSRGVDIKASHNAIVTASATTGAVLRFSGEDASSVDGLTESRII